MRDPGRIPALIAALAGAWTLNPDLRLGQLIVDVTSINGPLADPFQIEDDEMFDRVIAFGIQSAIANGADIVQTYLAGVEALFSDSPNGQGDTSKD